MSNTPVNYIKLLQLIENFCSSHGQIKRFGSDFIDQIDTYATSGATFPFVFAAPIDATHTPQQTIYNLRLYCLDIIQKDRSNINHVVSDTDQIIHDLKTYFSEESLDVPVLVLNSPVAQPLNDFGVDYLAGHYADFEFECDATNICEIPFLSTPVISGYTCDVYYTNDYLTCSEVTACTQLQDYVTQRISTATTQGAYLNLSGGTVSGSTTFTGTTTQVFLDNTGSVAGNYGYSHKLGAIEFSTWLDGPNAQNGGAWLGTVSEHPLYFYTGNGGAGAFLTGSTFVAGTLTGGTIIANKYYSGNTDVPLTDVFIQGTGAVGYIPVFTHAKYIGNSILYQNGTTLTVNGDVDITGNVTVLGTATTLNTQTVQSLDNNILLNYSGTHLSAIGGGISVLSGQASGAASSFIIDSNGIWSANTGVYTTEKFGITIDGQGGVVSIGNKGFISIPYNGTIQSWTLIADQSGSCIVDVWKTNAGVPTVADTISASAKPTLTSAQFSANTSLNGWTTSVAAGDVYAFNVDSCTGITRMNLVLKVIKY